MKMFKQTALYLALVAMLQGSLLMAQQIDSSVDETKWSGFNSAEESKETNQPSNPALPIEPKMSSAEIVNKPLSTADDLVREASNTTMVAGSCLVIDLFVRQFCTANPNDISCQYQ
jgi:hypothetical protein